MRGTELAPHSAPPGLTPAVWSVPRFASFPLPWLFLEPPLPQPAGRVNRRPATGDR